MDQVLFDIASFCLGWIGLYGALKKTELEQFSTKYGHNLKNYKIQIIDNYRNNISIGLTFLVVIGQITIKIFEDKIHERYWTYGSYIIMSLLFIVISFLLFIAISWLSKKLSRKKWCQKIKPLLLNTEQQVKEILSKENDYQKIESHIEYFEDILDIKKDTNSLKKRFDKITKTLDEL